MKKVTLSIYEGDYQQIERAASLWGETIENYIYEAALNRARALLSKQPKFVRNDDEV